MLDGVDDVDWAQLTCAGLMPDIPRCLRSLASADAGEAGEALEEIAACTLHQGTVYETTVAVVPFLAELASRAVHHRDQIVGALGLVADPRHCGAGDPARPGKNSFNDVRAAVAAQSGRLTPLLSDPDAQVRAEAAYTLAQCGDAVPADALWQRWAAEDSATARASVALALGVCDPAGSAAVLRSSMLGGSLEVRRAAALACVRAGIGWPRGAGAALAEAFAAEPGAVASSWQWPDTLLEEISAHASEESAADLLGRLVTTAVSEARKAVADAVIRRCRLSRSAPWRFVPLLGPLLRDPDGEVRLAAFMALREAGAAAAIFIDELTATAADYPAVARAQRFTAEIAAVSTLVRLGDPRWLGPVCAALDAGHGAGQVRLDVMVGLRFSHAALDAVRERLSGLAAAGTSHSGVIAGLLANLRGWGADAAAARPEVLAVLPLAPQPAATALAAITVAEPSALPRLTGVTEHLRAAALAGDLRSGLAVWRLTADAAPLVRLVEGRLSAGNTWELDGMLTQAPDAGPALRALRPELSRYLTGQAAGHGKQRAVQICAARIAWLAASEAAGVAPTVQAVLAAGGVPARAAAELAGLLGEAALEPELRDALADRYAGVAATRALWRLGVPVADRVPALTAEVMRHPWGSALDALGLLADMGAVTAVPALTRLAERDERVVASGRTDAIVWEDERLLRAIRDAVVALSGPQAGPGPERCASPSLGIDAE